MTARRTHRSPVATTGWGLTVRLIAAIAAVPVFAAALPVPAARADGLTPAQQQTLRAAESALRGAAGDLQAAQGSVGTAANPAKGSRRKLTLMRLGSAEQKLAAARTSLAGLPDGDAAVTDLAARLDKADASAAAMRAILDGGGSSGDDSGGAGGRSGGSSGGADRPDRRPPAGREGDAGGPRLDYRQKEDYKAASFNLREVQGKSKSVAKVLAAFDGGGPKPVYADVARALEQLAEGERKWGFMADRIKKLPGNHPDVQALVKAANAERDTLIAQRSRLEALASTLGKAASTSSYPRYRQDIDMLRDFTQRYRNTSLDTERPEEVVELLRDDPNVVNELKRMAKTYQPLVDQRTQAGETFRSTFAFFGETRTKFGERVKAHRAEVPGRIDGHLAEADRMADTAVAEGKPLYFGPNGGIAQQMQFARNKIAVLSAYDAKLGAQYGEKLAGAEKAMKARAKQLEAQIIAANKPAPDSYRGSDRDAMIEKARRCWEAEQPGAKVLAVVIPSEEWRRSVRWRWSVDEFRKSDTSRIQVQLIVKHDERLAVLRPVNLIMDHLAGDSVKAMPFRSLGEALTPSEFFLLSNVK